MDWRTALRKIVNREDHLGRVRLALLRAIDPVEWYMAKNDEERRRSERFVGSSRRECRDWILVLGRRHLEQILVRYIAHYNEARPHRGIGLAVPDGSAPPGAVEPRHVRRKDILGGLIHEYQEQAA